MSDCVLQYMGTRSLGEMFEQRPASAPDLGSRTPAALLEGFVVVLHEEREMHFSGSQASNIRFAGATNFVACLAPADAAVQAIRAILGQAEMGIGAEDEEDLPQRFGAVKPSRSAACELAETAQNALASSAQRRVAVLGLGLLGAQFPDVAGPALRAVIRSQQWGLQGAAVRAIDWGGLSGFDEELRALAAMETAPRWLRDYARDLVE